MKADFEILEHIRYELEQIELLERSAIQIVAEANPILHASGRSALAAQALQAAADRRAALNTYLSSTPDWRTQLLTSASTASPADLAADLAAAAPLPPPAPRPVFSLPIYTLSERHGHVIDLEAVALRRSALVTSGVLARRPASYEDFLRMVATGSVDLFTGDEKTKTHAAYAQYVTVLAAGLWHAYRARVGVLRSDNVDADRRISDLAARAGVRDDDEGANPYHPPSMPALDVAVQRAWPQRPPPPLMPALPALAPVCAAAGLAPIPLPADAPEYHPESLEHFCPICRVPFTTPGAAAAHTNSKAHKRTVQATAGQTLPTTHALEALAAALGRALAPTLETTAFWCRARAASAAAVVGAARPAPTPGANGEGDDDDNDDAVCVADDPDSVFSAEAPSDDPAEAAAAARPTGWDGTPLPVWLCRLHGLRHQTPCEVCGIARVCGASLGSMRSEVYVEEPIALPKPCSKPNRTVIEILKPTVAALNVRYRGPKNFSEHFGGSLHAAGLAILGGLVRGMPRPELGGLSRIDDVLAALDANPDSSDLEEVECAEGVMSRGAYLATVDAAMEGK